ncbi:sulfotransferase [Pelagovum pacificum]|nr:sulfotransferase [Pelagovum pacificum]
MEISGDGDLKGLKMQLSRSPEYVQAAYRSMTGRVGLRSSGKVFAIGMNKTGTSSLHRTFKELGFSSYHGTRWTTGQNKWLMHAFDCFSDGVRPDFRTLDQNFPGSKFILNVRAFDDWAISRLKHIARDIAANGDGDRAENWTASPDAINHWLDNREKHHSAILEYFAGRPDDLCIINFVTDANASTKVSDFLGRPAPAAKAWANAASGRGENPAHREMLNEVLQQRGLSVEAAKRDILVLQDPSGRFPVDTSQLDAS